MKRYVCPLNSRKRSRLSGASLLLSGFFAYSVLKHPYYTYYPDHIRPPLRGLFFVYPTNYTYCGLSYAPSHFGLAFAAKLNYFEQVQGDEIHNRCFAVRAHLLLSFNERRISLEREELFERQQAVARIAGAMAHELNNPLQGVLSLVVLCRADGAAVDNRMRFEQIHSGLLKVSQIVESFSVAYENLPRAVETTFAGTFLDLLIATLEERRLRTEVVSNVERDLQFRALVPETVRLLAEAFSSPSPADGIVNIRMEMMNSRAVLTCERKSMDSADPWGVLEDHAGCSGIAVLIDEMTKLAGGKPEYRFDQASLSSIRLCFELA